MTDPTMHTADPDLVSLVQMANAFGLEQELVLTLPGLVVAGTLVAAHTHFQGLAQVVQGDDPEGTLRSDLAARFRHRAQEYRDWGAGSKLGDLDPEGPQGEDLASMPQLAHLHLRDASVVSPSGATFAFWRARVADVVGWTLGG